MIGIDLETYYISEYQRLEDSGIFSDSNEPSDKLLNARDIDEIISDSRELMDISRLYSDSATYHLCLKSRMDEIRTLITHKVYTGSEANRLKQIIVEIHNVIRVTLTYINRSRLEQNTDNNPPQ